MKKKVVLILILCCMVCVMSLPLSATANSAPIHWTGGAFGGTIFTDDQCPIEVDTEVLTFDLPHFPNDMYQTSMELSQYNSTVTAQYDFYNPTDSDITATAVFPIGNKPQYVQLSDKEYIDYIQSKSTISTNDEELDRQLRFTYCAYTEDFEVDSQLKMLQSDYIEHPFFTPQLTVTKYTIKLSDFDIDTYSNAFFVLDLPNDGEQRTVIMQYCSIKTTNDSARLSQYIVDTNQLWEVVVLGQTFDILSQIKLYDSYTMQDDQQISGNISLQNTQTTTLLQFAQSCFEKDSPVSSADRYNIVVSELTQRLVDMPVPVVNMFDGYELYNSHIMIWYSYQLTVNSNSTVTNNITVPIFPEYFGSPKYIYTYFASPATKWSEFGGISIEFNTPYYFGANSLSIIEGTSADGFVVPFGHLTLNSDITFTLEPNNNAFNVWRAIAIIVLSALCFSLITTVVIAVILIKRLRKKK